MTDTGVVTDSCYPYASGTTGKKTMCSMTCTGSGAFKPYKALPFSSYTSIDDIQMALYTGGPIETGFLVFEDFMSYKSGIYVHKTGAQVGGHAVKIIGWGTEGGVNYWIVANSWGPDWGEGGYFRIKMGECEIEKQGIAGLPDLSNQYGVSI